MLASSKRFQSIEDRLQEAEVRLGQLEAILDGIDARIERTVRGAVAESEGLSSSSDVLQALELLDKKHDELRTAVARGIEDVERREARIRSTVGRARAELRRSGLEHPGLEAENRELRVIDGGGGDEEGVPPVSDDVEDPRHLDTSAIPGVVTEADIQRLMGA